MTVRTPLTALLAALLLPACSLVGGHKEPPRQFAPMPRSAPDASWPRVDGQLEIAAVQVSRPYDTLRIAVRPTPQELQVYKEGLWAQRPSEMLTASLLRTFEQSGKLRAVARAGSGISAGHRLLLDLRRFESDYAGGATPKATIEVTASLVRSEGGEVVATRGFVVAEPASGTSVDSVVDAFERGLDRIDHDVAGWTLASIASSRR